MLLDEHIANLDKIKSDIPKIAEDIVRKNSEKILDLVRYGQLAKGLDSFEKDLVYPGKTTNIPLYEPSTELYWAKQQPQPIKPKKAGERYNFEWTGETFRAMMLEIRGEGVFEIFTKDAKNNLLQQIYGTIFNLTDKHNEYINENIILPKLYEYLLNSLPKI